MNTPTPADAFSKLANLISAAKEARVIVAAVQVENGRVGTVQFTDIWAIRKRLDAALAAVGVP